MFLIKVLFIFEPRSQPKCITSVIYTQMTIISKIFSLWTSFWSVFYCR